MTPGSRQPEYLAEYLAEYLCRMPLSALFNADSPPHILEKWPDRKYLHIGEQEIEDHVQNEPCIFFWKSCVIHNW